MLTILLPNRWTLAYWLLTCECYWTTYMSCPAIRNCFTSYTIHSRFRFRLWWRERSIVIENVYILYCFIKNNWYTCIKSSLYFVVKNRFVLSFFILQCLFISLRIIIDCCHNYCNGQYCLFKITIYLFKLTRSVGFLHAFIYVSVFHLPFNSILGVSSLFSHAHSFKSQQ